MINLLTRQEIEEELGPVFAPEQTARLVRVVDPLWQMEVARAADTRALQQGLTALTEEVRQLAEAQARTEERLAEFEQRTEERFAALAEFQRRTEERLERLEAAVERLAAAQARTEERVGRLEAAVERLAEAQARTEERVGRLEAAVERLAEAQVRTEERLERLEAALERTNILVADLRGWQLELRYQERARAYFGPLLRRLRVLSLAELEEELEPHLPAAGFEDLLQADLLLSGQPRHRPEVPPVWLVVEASAVVDRHDVERAQRRAIVLREAGFRAIPTVAGEQLTAGAEEAIQAGHLLVLQDGRPRFWEDALAAALAD
jgi:DNA repair exonuclease SbcCD ATPase subunit